MVTSVRLLAAKDGVVVAASFAGKLKTVMQMVSIIYMIALMQFNQSVTHIPHVTLQLYRFGMILIWIATAATVISGIQYVWALRHYFKES
jgi:phosphatidylglycerophosphate synthase